MKTITKLKKLLEKRGILLLLCSAKWDIRNLLTRAAREERRQVLLAKKAAARDQCCKPSQPADLGGSTDESEALTNSAHRVGIDSASDSDSGEKTSASQSNQRDLELVEAGLSTMPEGASQAAADDGTGLGSKKVHRPSSASDADTLPDHDDDVSDEDEELEFEDDACVARVLDEDIVPFSRCRLISNLTVSFVFRFHAGMPSSSLATFSQT